MKTVLFILFSFFLAFLCGCDKEQGTDTLCEDQLTSITLEKDTVLTISFNDSIKLTNDNDVYLKFDHISDNCALDECGYCDLESKVYMSLSSPDCEADIPYFSFYKCLENRPITSPDFPVCEIEDLDPLHHTRFAIYGNLILTIVDVNIYAKTFSDLVAYNTDSLRLYKVTVGIKNRCN